MILEILKTFDLFGVDIKLLNTNGQQQYRSPFGGLITLIISILSLIYFLYIMILWATNQIIPKITVQQTAINYSELTLGEGQIKIRMFNTTIDPFKKTNNILTPVLYAINNTDFLPIQSMFSDQNGELLPNQLDLVFNLEGPSDQKKPLLQMMINFEKCNPVYGGECADDETIEQYLTQQVGIIELQVMVNQYDYNSDQYQQFAKVWYLGIDFSFQLYSQILISQQVSKINDGWLFDSYREKTTVGDVQVITQQLSQDYAKKLFGLNSHGFFLFRIDTLSALQNVAIPKLGEVLASIGSIVSFIFLLQHAAYYFNSRELGNQLLRQYLEYVYPQMKQMNINRNLFGQIKQVSFNRQQISINEFRKFYTKMSKIAEQKLQLTNLLYEILKIQEYLQLKFGFQDLTYCHQLGVKIPEYIYSPNKEVQVVPENDIINISENIEQNTLLSQETIELFVRR